MATGTLKSGDEAVKRNEERGEARNHHRGGRCGGGGDWRVVLRNAWPRFRAGNVKGGKSLRTTEVRRRFPETVTHRFGSKLDYRGGSAASDNASRPGETHAAARRPSLMVLESFISALFLEEL